jgi:alpha-tubulin suppressor-like RCC1 family protein
MAIFQDTKGVLYSWGTNERGELGQGDSVTPKLLPQPVLGDLKGVCSLAPGHDHVLALTTDHKIYVWGENIDGALGLGSEEFFISSPQLLSLPTDEKVIKVASGFRFSTALTSQGSLFTWGSNFAGCLGQGLQEYSSPLPALLPPLPSKIIDMACGFSHLLVLTEDGTAYACGANSSGEIGMGLDPEGEDYQHTSLTKIFEQVAEISCGSCHSMLITKNGTLYGCGWNRYGILGLGDRVNRHVMTRIMSNVTSMANGSTHCLVQTTDGSTWTWGENDGGQLFGHHLGGRWLETPVNVDHLVPPEIISYGCGCSYSFFVDGKGGCTSSEILRALVLQPKFLLFPG